MEQRKQKTDFGLNAKREKIYSCATEKTTMREKEDELKKGFQSYSRMQSVFGSEVDSLVFNSSIVKPNYTFTLNMIYFHKGFRRSLHNFTCLMIFPQFTADLLFIIPKQILYYFLKLNTCMYIASSHT